VTGAEPAPLLTYADVITRLRLSYAHGADARERATLAEWKLTERARCLAAFQEAGVRTVLEVGAGTGKDSLYFQQHGLAVTATDLSPAMVAWCRRKGVPAEVRDLLNLDFPPASFDAVYTINCLLHLPKPDLPAALAQIAGVLRPGGLAYIGLYGGIDQEGIAPDDQHQPPRFFSFHTDAGMYHAVSRHFEVLSFSCIRVERDTELHFQSFLLQRAARPSIA
jgi:SAM-dependent methyltransferase